MEYNNIRLNKTIANKIGAFKPSEFAKKGVKVGDYLISCHFGDVILLTAEKMNVHQYQSFGEPQPIYLRSQVLIIPIHDT